MPDPYGGRRIVRFGRMRFGCAGPPRRLANRLVCSGAGRACPTPTGVDVPRVWRARPSAAPRLADRAGCGCAVRVARARKHPRRRGFIETRKCMIGQFIYSQQVYGRHL